jgi:hypothetical protein
MDDSSELGNGTLARPEDIPDEQERDEFAEHRQRAWTWWQPDWSCDPLENWIKLGIQFARWEIRRWRWRGTAGGVLPGGYDAESVGLEAVEELVRPGPGKSFQGMDGLQRELKRLVRLGMHRLYRRQENRILVNEWDLLPRDENGELQSVLPEIPDEAAGPAEVLMQEEDAARARELQRSFERSLGNRKDRLVFRAVCRGVVKREEIGKRLGLSVGEVREARRRLDRRARRFAAENGLGRLVDHFSE